MFKEKINITSAKYVKGFNDVGNAGIKANIDGQDMSVPLDPDNRHYAEILKQVEEGTLTIKDAD